MNFLLAPYVAALVLFAAELRGALTRVPLRVRIASPWFIAGMLVVTYVAQLAVLRQTAITSLQYSRLERLGEIMPIPVIYPGFPNADAWSAIFVGLGAVQSALLVLFYRLKISRSLLWCGCAAMLAVSIAAPVLGSFDLYGYVHDALLGQNAWWPPNVPFTGEYRVFDLWWKEPTTSLYGPLWIPIVQLVTAAAPTLTAKMMSYRLFSAILFVALLFLLRVHGQPRRILAAVALNPALAFQTVANGHNDLIAIVLIVACSICVRRFGTAGAALLVLAGLIKLPYALLGLPVLSIVRPALRRASIAVGVIVATLLLSWYGGGTNYLHALRLHSGARDASELAHGVVVAVALALVVLAVAGKRRYVTGVWLMPSMASFRLPLAFPWYSLFAFGYALDRRRVLRYLLISLPFVTALITPELMRVWTFIFTIPAATLLSLNLGRGKASEPA